MCSKKHRPRENAKQWGILFSDERSPHPVLTNICSIPSDQRYPFWPRSLRGQGSSAFHLPRVAFVPHLPRARICWPFRLENRVAVNDCVALSFNSGDRRAFPKSSARKCQTTHKYSFGRNTSTSRSNKYLLHSVRPEIPFLTKVFARTGIFGASSTRGGVRSSLAPG